MEATKNEKASGILGRHFEGLRVRVLFLEITRNCPCAAQKHLLVGSYFGFLRCIRMILRVKPFIF